jgi:hypothetical protein
MVTFVPRGKLGWGKAGLSFPFFGIYDSYVVSRTNVETNLNMLMFSPYCPTSR